MAAPPVEVPCEPSDLARLWAKIEKVPSGCWEWTGGLSAGRYGHLKWGGRLSKAHIVMYELYVSKVPDGLELDHLCENTICVNPDHLEPVTHAENIRRAAPRISAALQAIMECPRGHPYDEANTYIRPNDGHRQCRACQRLRDRRRYHARKQEVA
jgi:hypothetical protein